MGVGAQRCPLGLHALWVLRAAGLVGGRPRGGWPATVVRGVWCQALSLRRPPVFWGGQLGYRDPCVPAAVGAGVGTQHRLYHSVRPCGPALLAVGVAEGRPRGGAFHHCEGRLVSGAVPPPAGRPLERAARVPRPVCPGCGRCGRVGTQHRPHSVRPCGPVSLAVGVAEGCPRGGCLPPLCEGRLRSGAVPPLTARPLGAWEPVCSRHLLPSHSAPSTQPCRASQLLPAARMHPRHHVPPQVPRESPMIFFDHFKNLQQLRQKTVFYAGKNIRVFFFSAEFFF